jgi:hypothetical protein
VSSRTRHPRRTLARLLPHALLLALAFGLSLPAEALLTYSLYAPLKSGSCLGDGDGDCLDDGLESSLAWAVSPWYFYDEDEDCSGWTNRFGLPSSHFARQDYVQVRPHGQGVSAWSGSDGKAKWVTVTFFFLYPHDCGVNFGISGHQGDSERVYFNLYSYDLYTWYLSSAYYDHHNHTDYVSGSWLETQASSLGTSWASVAADEDKHGSWPGRYPSSSHCAGSMDDIIECFGGSCDCFINTWRSDFQNGYYDLPSASRNVGGPLPEQWKAPHVTVSGSEAYTALDVGHGYNREYWTPKSGPYQYFCGWECPAGWRLSSGDCAFSVHDRSNCAHGPLANKVDDYPFTLPPPPPQPSNSCVGYCGGSTGSCYCDAACVGAGDCCYDACFVCGQCPDGGGPIFPELTAADAPTAEAELVTPLEEAAERAGRARRLAAQAMADLRRRAGADGSDRGNDQRWHLARSADPVAALVPMLLDVPRHGQLAALTWAASVSHPERLTALFDDLGHGAGAQRAAAARERVLDLIALLEVDGVRAKAGPGLPPAWIDPDAPILTEPGEDGLFGR